jgi:hypothetical protein
MFENGIHPPSGNVYQENDAIQGEKGYPFSNKLIDKSLHVYVF